MKRLLVLFVIVAIVIAFVYVILSFFKEDRVKAYYDHRVIMSQNNFQSAIASFEQVYTNIYNDKLNVDEVKSLIHNASADPVNRDKYRNWLRIYTKPIYDSLKSIGLTHMHYHFADATSFLRMHRPFFFGDDLSFRDAVVRVKEKKELVQGFENGRHLLAYRFIFPLEYDGEYIGSVELSVGVREIINMMSRIYGLGYSYLLEKDKVFKNYTGTTADGFQKFSITEDFFMDTCDACISRSDPACTHEDIKTELKQIIRNKNSRLLKDYKAFSEISVNNTEILYSYLPIFDINGKGMGYIISHSTVEGYGNIIKTYKALFIFISIGAVSLVLIVFALDYSRRKTAQMNDTLERKVVEKVQELRDKEQFFAQQSKMVTMGEMVASILHQWKQPLNSISMLTDLLLFDCEKLDCDQKVFSNLQNIKEQTHFMAHTGNDFRNFMKPSKEKSVFSVTEAIDDVIRLFEFSFTRYGLNIEKEWDKDTERAAKILGYQNEFKHVILNLFNNSRDAIVNLREKMVADGEDVHDFDGAITIKVEIDGEFVKVKLSDTGGGIKDNSLPHVFEKYFTTKPKEGSGIGLYMSREMVQTSMNGFMTVKNIIGGAEFTLRFPIVTEDKV